jgi:DNA adenine methylase
MPDVPAGPVSPFVWFGGKQRLAGRIAALLPAHLVYVEPFGGACAVLLTKAPSRLEVYNDRDESLVNFFQVLRDRPEELERKLRLTPFSREEFARAVASWRVDFTDVRDDPVEWARLFWTRVEQSFAGTPTTVGWAGEFRGRRRGSRARTSFTKLNRIERICARLRLVQIENLDWRQVLDRYDGPDACFYCDPPYEPTTRKPNRQKGNRAYNHDLTAEHHVELIARLLACEASVLVSGYDHPVYRELEQEGFERFEFEALSAAANALGADARRVEVVWRRARGEGRLFTESAAVA